MESLLFSDIDKKTINDFPDTRYQGSKQKILSWIWEHVKSLKFNSVLDAFGGSGSVAYLFKTKGKQVFYNDNLKFNHCIGKALIENNDVLLTHNDIDLVLSKKTNNKSFIANTFAEVYFTNDENKWLDQAVANIHCLPEYKKEIALFALFQACVIKRPFNLFHRKNLYIRTADVERSFGNKTTWDKPFEDYFRKFCEEANSAIFNNGKKNSAYCEDVFDLNCPADLVYIDTPYISSKGTGVDYLDFYHFLEGVCDYESWGDGIDWDTKNLKLKKRPSIWTNKNKIYEGFDQLFNKYKDSKIVVSYRGDGIPSVEELKSILKRYKSKIYADQLIKYKYVLSKNASQEILLIAE